jgi:hypothetical protein
VPVSHLITDKYIHDVIFVIWIQFFGKLTLIWIQFPFLFLHISKQDVISYNHMSDTSSFHNMQQH